MSTSGLIYDVGMHRGEDTAFYLAKGFRVVAFEADPELAQQGRTRFDEAIRAGNLIMVEGAIVNPEQTRSSSSGSSATVGFYRNRDVSEWGTVNPEWAERNRRMGTSISVCQVTPVDFGEALARHGIPYYLKIDIEGADLLCLEALRGFAARPNYVSLESSTRSLAEVEREIGLLSQLGYDSFQAVEQAGIPNGPSPPNPPCEGRYVDHRFALGSSGLFGRELPGPWLSRKAVLARHRRIMTGYRILGDRGAALQWSFPGAGLARAALGRLLTLYTGGKVPGWYDTHARHRSAAAAQHSSSR